LCGDGLISKSSGEGSHLKTRKERKDGLLDISSEQPVMVKLSDIEIPMGKALSIRLKLEEVKDEKKVYFRELVRACIEPSYNLSWYAVLYLHGVGLVDRFGAITDTLRAIVLDMVDEKSSNRG